MTLRPILLSALAAFGAGVATAAVKLPAIFGDHMVLQQGTDLRVWGTANPGERVTVAIAGDRGQAVAGSDGKWSVKLAPLAVTGRPAELEVVGSNRVTFQDVLVGDVWICSGQSNMELGIGAANNATAALAQANRPLLRLFVVNKAVAFTPQDDCSGTWRVCTPENLIAFGGWAGFSAVGYFFGSEIQADLKIPVGLVGTYWGGTPAQSWTSLEALRANPALARHADSFDKTVAHLPELRIKYVNETLPKWEAKRAAWKLKPDPKEPFEFKPYPPDLDPYFSAVLFNAMIHPILPFAIKGVVWYQGAANAYDEARLKEYQILFPAMITDWRRRWGEGDFPFLFVQLPLYAPGSSWPSLRNSQLQTLSLPATGMAVTLDLGDHDNIHPRDKQDVGHRLALAALHVAYGEKLVYSGPIYDSMSVEGDKISLRFKDEGGGLVIGSAPPTRIGQKKAEPSDHLQAFEIAGADGKFLPAKAWIDGDRVVVESGQVSAPVAARYAWAADPEPAANLYNKEGLPASPFSTAP